MAKGNVRTRVNKNAEDSLEKRSKLIRKDLKKKRLVVGDKTPLTKKYGVRIEAHRGANKLEYQNTLKAYGKAIELDSDGIELDVWLTRDRVAIVTHGTTEAGLLELKTGFKKNIQDVTAEELQSQELPDGSHIPTLDEVFDYLLEKGFPISLNIELKGHNHELVEKVVQSVQKYGVWDQINLSSFNHSFRITLEQTLKKMKIKREVTFGFLCWQKDEFPNFNELLIKSNDIFTVDAELLLKREPEATKELLKEAKGKGLRLGFYFPMKHEETDEDFHMLCEAGADCIIANDIAKLNKFFEERKALKVVA
jgi:glycerophosphoryl diester phosphodiesterase